MISRFIDSQKDAHWQAGKRITRYVSGTKYFGIMYSNSENFKLIGYIRSDNGGRTDDRKNTYGYTFHFGTGVVSLPSKKQPIVTLSSAKAEYVAPIGDACQAVWKRTMLK